MTEGQGAIGLQSLNARVEALGAALAQAERELACRDALIKDHLGTIMHLRNRVDDEAFRAETAEAALAKAVEALKPFAAVEPMNVWNDTEDDGGVAVLTENQFRAARAAMPETESRE